jgi:uncharacterized protein YjbI with pentapeptide repeats
VVWRFRGALRVTVAVKATFALVHGARATLRAPVDLVRSDVCFDRDPTRSVERQSDLVPFRPGADVTFVGHAHAPPGRAVPAMAVRLAVHGERALVDKTLHVFGDRTAGAPGSPAPFPRMPIRYERAYGGPSFEANPVGCGADAGPSGALPNLVDTADPRRPAGLGPIAAHWAGRGRIARGVPEAAIFDLPDDLSWERFHAAPPDQRAPYLRGDEWIVLDGLHPALPRVQTQLPSARGVARVHQDGKSSDVQLQADTLAIDGDAQGFSVVWRGSFAVSGEEALGALEIVGGLEMPGQPVAWPDPAAPAVHRRPAHLAATAGLSFGEQRAVARRPATPFEGEHETLLDRPTAGALPPPEREPEPEPPPVAAPPPVPVAAPPRRTPAIPVFNRTPFVLVTIPWQVSPPKDSLTVFVKGTFDLVPGAPARRRAESDLPTGDVHHDDDPARSLAYASDFAVFKPKADVLLRGSAHRGAMGIAQVSFSFGRPGNQFERRIAVFGERRWRAGLGAAEPGSPEPFDAIPLVYERSFGGPRFDANPLGVGHAASGGEPARLPNLEDPARLVTAPRDTPPPACFAPIPITWKERRSKLGTYGTRWLEARWPYFPEDFEWSYFQAAPREQQLAYLSGDEPFEIVGMHRDHPTLRGSLPGLRPRCAIEETREAGGALRELALRLDTASFDVEAMRLDLVWRGVIEVSGDEAPEIAALLLTVEDMARLPATLEQVRAACLLPATIAPVEESPGPAANDVAPEADPRQAAFEAEIQARLEAAQKQLDRAGFGAAPDPSAPKPAPPPPPDPEAIAASLRAAGAGEKAIAELLEVLRAAREARPPEAPKPEGKRARVIAMLEAGASFEGADLAGVDLSGLDLGGRALARANLAGAKLASCNLAGADLSFAQVGGADLAGANLEGANLAGADLTGAKLAGAVLEGARLDGASFSEASGEGASFRGARGASAVFADGAWKRARFDEAALPAADFTRATLDGASFVDATMPEVRLFEARGIGARFDGARIVEARADECSLTECSFQRADASRSTWEKAVLDASSFRAATLAGASFVRASCGRAVFSAAEMSEARCSRASLVEAQLLKANLMKATFDRADLTRADLRGANLHGAETWKAKLDGALLELAIVTRSKLVRRA